MDPQQVSVVLSVGLGLEMCVWGINDPARTHKHTETMCLCVWMLLCGYVCSFYIGDEMMKTP